MAERNPSEGRGFATVLNVLLIVATVAGGILLARQELTSDRPPVHPPLRSEMIGRQAIDVRLWEDPLSAKPSPGDGGAGSGRPGEEPKQCPRGGGDWASTVAGRSGRASEPKKAAVRRAQEEERADSVVLPVMVPGGPYSEDQESRIRTRFAVVSALGERGYAPRDQQHIGEVTLRWPTEDELLDCEVDLRNDSAASPQDRQRVAAVDQPTSCYAAPWGSSGLVLRYEWYRRGGQLLSGPSAHGSGLDPVDVLVLWLDERQFADAPLERLALLIGPLLQRVAPHASGTQPRQEERKAVVRVIGPRSSDVLRNMVPCSWATDRAGCAQRTGAATDLPRPPAVLQQVELYSATASAMTKFLIGQRPAECEAAGRACLAAALRAGGLKGAYFFNADDGQMADEILDELRLRNVDLIGGPGRASDAIVLLSERDTFFGRMLSETYESALEGLMTNRGAGSGARTDSPGDPKKPDNLQTFTFLRGLDGKTVCTGSGRDCDKPKEKRERDGRPSSMEEIVAWSPEANKAEGPGQLDYLVRTGDLIAKRRDELRVQGKGDIKAIGIVGSDVYDVLLILQALRPRFPDILFFTTELDARYLDPSQRGWARNLIIASSYGLSLDRELQGSVSPFRDSAQSAQFAATLAALPPMNRQPGDEALAVVARDGVAPRRFEVGNKTAVDLSTLRTRNAQVHPPIRSDRPDGAPTRSAMLVLGLLALLAMLAGYYLCNPLRGRAVGELGYASAPLEYADADIGGSEGAKLLVAALARPDPVAGWLARRLLDDYAVGKEPVPATPADSFALEDLAGLPPADAAKKHAEVLERQKRDQRRMSALLELLNGIVHHVVQIDEAVFKGSSLTDAALVASAAPWQPPIAWWNGVARMRQRHRARKMLDDLLDRLTAAHGGNEENLKFASDARRSASKMFHIRTQLVRFIVGLSCTALFVAAALALTIWRDTYFHAEGEPFSLVSGASAWPNVILRVASTLLAIGCGIVLVQRLRYMFFDLTRRYWFPFSDTTSATQPDAVAPSTISAASLWRQYYQYGRPKMRLVRAMVPTVVYFVAGQVILGLLGFPFQPLRGTAVWVWSKGDLYPFVLTFLLLSFLTIDASLRCRRFIQQIASLPTKYPATTLQRFHELRGGVEETYLEEWIDVQLIADLTERVGGLLWFPSIVFCVMLASLIQWTDHWPTSPGLLIVLGLNFAIAIASVVILQRAAKQARAKAEESLDAKVKSAQALAAPSRRENDAAQAQKLLDEIRTLKRGAFVGFWESPVLGAALVPSGGTALLQLLFWFSNS